MKKLISILILAGVLAASGQNGFRNSSGNVLPHMTALVSNDVFTVGTTGSPISPTNKNARWGTISGQLKSDHDLKHSASSLNTDPLNPYQVKRMLSRIYNRQKINIAFLGDSVGVDVQPCVEDALLPFMERSGGAVVSVRSTGDGYFYLNRSGTSTYYAAGLDGVFWGKFCALGNAATFYITSPLSNMFTANVAGAAWYQNTAFGSMLLEVQDEFDDWYPIATLSGSGGAGLTMVTTNINLVPILGGPGPWKSIRVTATGTNIPVALKLWDDRTGLGFTSSCLDTPGVSPIGQMINAGSNNVAKFFSWLSPDLLFYKAERLLTATNELPWFEGMISNTVPLCDVVYLPYHNSPLDGWGKTNRNFMLEHGRRFNRAVVDIYAASLPFAQSSSNGLYNADGVHLVNAGYSVLHSRVPSQLGFGFSEMYAMGLSMRGSFTQTNDTTKASLSGGNTFTGDQNFNNTITVLDGYVEIKGASKGFSALGLWNQTVDQKFAIQRSANNFLMRDSVTSYDMIFAISNLGGIHHLELPTAGQVPQMTKGKRADYYGRTVSVTNLDLQTPTGTPANTTTPANYITITNGGVRYFLPAFQ